MSGACAGNQNDLCGTVGRSALFPCAYDYENYAGHEGEATKDRRKRDRFGSVLGGMDGSHIQYFVALCVGNALISERENSKNEQHDAEDGRCLHACSATQLDNSSALNNANQNDNDCKREKDMNKAAHGV